MLKSVSAVGGFTLLSRLFGFVRDILLARYLGAGMAADAFWVAFKLPNFFRRLFAEGALAVSFVPLFARLLGQETTPESQKAAEAFAGRVLGVLLPVLILFLIIMEVAMAPIIFGLTGGFDGDTVKFELAVELGRYTFPYLLLISLVSFFGGILNVFGRYSAAAFAPVLLNLSMISALIIYGGDQIITARALAISVSVAGILQLIWVYGAALKAGIRISLPRPKLSSDVKELLRIMAPAAIGAGVMQINLLIDMLMATRLLPEGSISWLVYADRLNQLPLAVIGIAVGTVLLPSISRLVASGNDKLANSQQNKALEMSLFLTLPATFALIIIAGPLISTLFEGGHAFTATDAVATSGALMVYACGLPAYVIAKILTPGYFARKDTKTPVRFAIVSMVINTLLGLWLLQYWAHMGLAAATAIAAWINAGMLYIGLVRRGHYTMLSETRLRVIKCLIASVVMGAVIWALHAELAGSFAEAGWLRIGALALLIASGILVYAASILGLRTFTMAELKRYVGR